MQSTIYEADGNLLLASDVGGNWRVMVDSEHHWTDEWGRTFAIESLVWAWSAEVQHTRDAAGQSSDAAWNADDYVGALFARDRLEAALQTLGGADRRKFSAEVEATDKLLRAITEPDPDHLVAQRGDLAPAPAAWWWTRIPASGPIRDEFVSS